jgi:signal transduction histidine kinase
VTGFRKVAEPAARLYAILGAPGLTIGLFSLLSLGFGLYVLAREYDRLRVSGRAALRPVIGGWVRTTPVHYLGLTLTDYADAYQRAPSANRPTRLRALRRALETLGESLEAPRWQSPLVHIEELHLAQAGDSIIASWRPKAPRPHAPTELIDRIVLLPTSPSGPEIDLTMRYRLAPEVERVAVGLETSYHRLLLALVGLSGYSLLCLGAMLLHVRSLRDRVAREAAQQATLDLADRTCHELGNVAFVLTNERKNLSDLLDLVERFVTESGPALDSAAHRAGLDLSQIERLRRALRREYGDRGIDPDVELLGGVAIAQEVCRQVAVCSDYISLTVRELDAYLKQSALPIVLGSVEVDACLNDALSLLAPALDASDASVRRDGDSYQVLADRRLLVHALVNLLKNALEAMSGGVNRPVLTLTSRIEGSIVWIEIGDNGPGIPERELARVFELGYSTKSPGRGRGLTVARESIESQGGHIRIVSQVGEGTRFSIGLPQPPSP